MPEIIKPKPKEAVDFNRHLARLQALQDLREETNLWQEKVDLHVDTQGFPYFMLLPLSDLHIGHQGVDMDELGHYLRYLKDYPVQTVLVGDLGDFFSPTKHPDGMLGDVITPDDQLLLLKRFMETYQDKILAVVQDPSHGDWVRQSSGIEPYRWITEDLNIPLLQSGGLLDLSVNNERYRISLYHAISKFNSSFNRTHAAKRSRELHRDCDMVISGHVHIGAMEKAVHREDTPYFVQLGTFKVNDGFGTRNGMFPKPQPFYPTLLFDGRRHNIEAIEDPDSAMEFINAMKAYQTTLAVGTHGSRHI